MQRDLRAGSHFGFGRGQRRAEREERVHTHTVDDKTIQPQRPFKEAVLELLVDLHNLHIKDEKMDESSPVPSRLFVHKKGQIHIQANSSVNSYHSVTFELNATRKSLHPCKAKQLIMSVCVPLLAAPVCTYMYFYPPM